MAGTDRIRFKRWHNRIERGLVRLLEKPYNQDQKTRLTELREKNRVLAVLDAPLARLYDSLGELSLKLGFQVLAIVLLERARKTDPRDPLPAINLSRARLGLANRFLLRAPASGATHYNLDKGKKELDRLISSGRLPETRLVEATILRRRIEDRLELWTDLKKGDLEPARIREILTGEDREIRPLLSGKLPGLSELEKLAPARTGFYYREYREEQKKKRRR